MRDIRQAPFSWQSVNAMRSIRATFHKRERTIAVAIYQAFTEAANLQRGGKFKATRTLLAELAGVSVRTLDLYAQRFEELGLIKITKSKSGKLNLPNDWELLDLNFVDASQGGVVSSAAPGVVHPAAPGGGAAHDTLREQPETLGEGIEVSAVKKSIENKEDVGKKISDLDSLFNHWMENTKPRNKTLSPSRKRLLEKALAERSLEECVWAVDGLIAWQKQRGGGLELSRIFQTRPGGSPLGEQIDFFISVGKNAGIAGSGFPSADPAVIARRKQEVQRGHRLTDTVSVRKAEKAEAWLREYGIEVIRREDGFPTFRKSSDSSD